MNEERAIEILSYLEDFAKVNELEADCQMNDYLATINNPRSPDDIITVDCTAVIEFSFQRRVGDKDYKEYSKKVREKQEE